MITKIKSAAFFIEVLIVICFLGIFSAILSHVFVNSYNQSIKSKELIWANSQAISVIEKIKSYSYDEYISSDDFYNIYYDKDFKICGIEDSLYDLSIKTIKEEKNFGVFINYDINVTKEDMLITSLSSGQYRSI